MVVGRLMHRKIFTIQTNRLRRKQKSHVTWLGHARWHRLFGQILQSIDGIGTTDSLHDTLLNDDPTCRR